MSLSKLTTFLNKLSVRLVIGYGILLLISLIIVYGLTVFALTQSLGKRMEIRLTEEIHEFEELYKRDGLEMMKAAFAFEMAEEDMSKVFFQLMSPADKVLLTSDLSDWSGVNFDFFAQNSTKDDRIFFYTTFDSLRNHKVMTAQKKINGNHILRFGHLLNEDEELIRSYKTRFGSVVLFMFPLIAIVMWLLTKRTVRGIYQVTLAANQITQGNLKARVIVERESTEITLLANTFNSMSERIELLVKEMRDVTHNIAHDLRSPVTRIRGTAEITLSGSQQLSDYQEMTGVIIEECDNLTNMINTLLDIAEADSSISGVEKIKIDLKKLVEEGHELFLPLAKLKQIKLTFQTASEEVLILGRLQHIQRMISNLIDNAIKYTEKGGSILIQLAEEEDQAILSVIDSGVGIPKDELEHIFKPFYRCDQSRSTPGNGLGLSYVRSVVESHGGTVSVVSVLNQGSTFRTTFPR